MEVSTEQQIFDQVKKSNRILIALPENLTADVVGAGLALWSFLGKLQKTVFIVSSGHLPENLNFLPNSANIRESKSIALKESRNIKSS